MTQKLKPILTIVRGLPGSGKSTYARKLADRCPLYHGRGLGSQEGRKKRNRSRMKSIITAEKLRKRSGASKLHWRNWRHCKPDKPPPLPPLFGR